MWTSRGRRPCFFAGSASVYYWREGVGDFEGGLDAVFTVVRGSEEWTRVRLLQEQDRLLEIERSYRGQSFVSASLQLGRLHLPVGLLLSGTLDHWGGGRFVLRDPVPLSSEAAREILDRESRRVSVPPARSSDPSTFHVRASSEGRVYNPSELISLSAVARSES